MTLIQYSSQLFLSFKPFKSPEKLIKPSAPILVLAGNCFRHSAQLNTPWLDYISSTWKNTIIVPGFLEHSYIGAPICDTYDAYDNLTTEINKYNNIYLLSSKTHMIDNLIFTGVTKWPNQIPQKEVDPPSEYMHDKYKIQSALWKYEEDEWLRDKLSQYEYSYLYKHILVSYYPPMCNFIPLSDRKYINDDKSDYQCYSAYGPLELYKISCKLWIYGSPRAAVSGMCPHNNTFITSNSADAAGYLPSIITEV